MADPSGEVERKRVTRDVGVPAVGDLLEHAPRATLAFVDVETVDLVPVRPHCSGERYFFAVATGTAADLDHREVVLVLDDGAYWFELRGISVRGTASRAEPPVSERPPRLEWYEVAPRRVLAWDYATLHEE